MTSKRKRTHNTDTIAISSSSSSSQASEEGVLESDEESPSRSCGYAAADNMSERQTRKINSGSFGMFNHPTLMPHLPRSPGLGKKRRRTKEYSGYKDGAISSRSGSRSQHAEPEISMADDDDDEDEQSLFVPDTAPLSQPITINDDPESDEELLYECMTPERARKAKEYIHVLDSVEMAETSLQTAADELSAAAAEHATLSQKLAAIDTTADGKIAEIIKERDEAIKIANEQAEQRVRRVRERLPAKKESYEERMQDWFERKTAAEDSIAIVEAEIVIARERKDELERQGGFELCSDVRDAQARKANK